VYDKLDKLEYTREMDALLKAREKALVEAGDNAETKAEVME
jgi:hypothetical protein